MYSIYRNLYKYPFPYKLWSATQQTSLAIKRLYNWNHFPNGFNLFTSGHFPYVAT